MFRVISARLFQKCLVIIGTFVLPHFTCHVEAVETVEARLLTRWGKELNQENPLQEYPRPQLKRESWQCLNGYWDYSIVDKGASVPENYEGSIVVPFPVESDLSGVAKTVGAKKELWYRRKFSCPKTNKQERTLLHFGAVDWECAVWINGEEIGQHKGGFDPFSFDITDQVEFGDNEITLRVWDPTDDGNQPRGKQINLPHGIWYTAVTGIWQTVWLERTPQKYIEKIRVTPDVEHSSIQLLVSCASQEQDNYQIRVLDGEEEVVTAEGATGKVLEIEIPDGKLWSPVNPHLYDLEIQLSSGDKVASYFGLRKIELRKDKSGINRLFLNNEPLFQYGLLDQGWWPDGLYTAPSDEALRYDIEITKKLGFNMIRKHVKVEPARWYYWCDKLGLLVWQDMPNGDDHIGPNDPDIKRTKESSRIYLNELKAMISSLYNHPSIVMWVPFNEGWGQWNTVEVSKLVGDLDPSRIVNHASGWADRGAGDLVDLHIYPGPEMASLEEDRAIVLGEFGGYGLALPGHLWTDSNNWGYRNLSSESEFVDKYEAAMERLRLLVIKGLSAAVYTQTTDVEVEVNGIMTYDRELIKLPESIKEIHQGLYEATPRVNVLVNSGSGDPQEWRYTTSSPGDSWVNNDFDDSSWHLAKAGFGANDPPNVKPRTEWLTSEIWLRKKFTVDDIKCDSLHLFAYHDEDAQVYLNGYLISSLPGYSTSYKLIQLDDTVGAYLQEGRNVLSVHCMNTLGPQYIDIGLVDIKYED